MSRDIKRLQSAISQPALTLMCFTEHKWVGNWEREGENEKERGLWGESFHSLFSLWLSSGEPLLALSPYVLSISVTHNALWLPALEWISSPALKHVCCLTQESDEVRNRRGRWQKEWERATVMRLKEMPSLHLPPTLALFTIRIQLCI